MPCSGKRVPILLTLLLALLPLEVTQAAETLDLPADPATRHTVALEAVWRLGGDDEEVLLGLVNSGVIDDDGNVLLADRQLAQVLVVSPTGEVIATLGRAGDGPGELRNLESAFVAGDRVGLVQRFPGKVVYIDREGAPAGGFTLGGEEAGGHYAIRALRSRDDVLVGLTDRSHVDFEADRVRTHATLSVLSLDGVFESELIVHDVTRGIMTIVLDEEAEWAEYATWALGPGSVIATVADRRTWSVNERNLAGDLLRTLRRPGQNCRRTDEEKEQAAARISVAVATGRSTIEKKAFDTDPVIVDLQYARDGRLFVTTCHNTAGRLAPGVAARYDVIAPDGRFTEELTLTFGGFDPEQDKLVFLDGTNYLVIRNYEDAQKAIYAAMTPTEEQTDPIDAEPLEIVLVRIPG